MEQLTVRQMMTLDHAAHMRDTAGWHEWRRDVLGYRTATGFYAELLRLLDSAEAEAYAPLVVRRQRRLRDARRAQRSATRAAHQ